MKAPSDSPHTVCILIDWETTDFERDVFIRRKFPGFLCYPNYTKASYTQATYIEASHVLS